MSRSRRFLKGVVSGYAYQILVLLTGLWMTPFLLRHLGQHDYGLWLTGLQLMLYLSLVDLGIIALLPRTVAYAVGRATHTDDAREVADVIGQTTRTVLWQTPLVALAALLLWLAMPAEWSALRGPIGLLLLAFALLFPLRIFAAVLEGLQEQAFAIRASMAAWAIGTLVNVVLVLGGSGLYSLAFGWCLQQTIVSAACGYRLFTRFRHLLPASLPTLRWADAARQAGRGFWVTASQVGNALLQGTDLLIVSKFLGPEFVVPYACTGKLASVLANQPQLLMHMAVPGLSEMKAGVPKERLRDATLALTQGLLFLTGLFISTILVINEGFVRRWVGDERYAGLTITVLVLCQMLLRHLNLTFAYTIFCFGFERRMAIVAVVDGLVTAGVMLLLVHPLGYIGVALGSIAGVSLVSLPLNTMTVASELQLSMRDLCSPIWPWLWRFSIILTACGVVVTHWVPGSVGQTIAAGLLTAIVYCAVMLPALLHSRLSPYLWRTIDVPQWILSKVGASRLSIGL